MEENKFDVSIIIINYNTYNLLLNCIESIHENVKDVDYEIIVVDNNSKDRNIENLNNIYPNVRLVLSNINNGFGSGNNLGVKYAKGKYVFFLNSDTILISNAVKEMLVFSEFNENVGICGGNLYDIDYRPTISFERLKPSVLNSIDNLLFNFFKKIRYGNNMYFNHSNNVLEIKGYISGANFFIRKEIFLLVGGFNENFFMYYEEVELTYRVNKLGLKNFVIPKARIIHLGGGSQNNISDRKLKWMKDSLNTYAKCTNLLFPKLFILVSNLIFLRNKLFIKE